MMSETSPSSLECLTRCNNPRLTLGGGLLIFASVLSDAYLERPRRSQVINDAFEKVTSSSLFDYKYGWSFFAAGAAFFMSELAAVLSISAYVRRFPTMEDMVRVMVPGAERKLKERHGLAGEYLVQHQNKYQRQEPDTSVSMTSGLSSKCKSEGFSDFEGVEGPLYLSKPAPDICTSNPAAVAENIISFAGPPSASSNIIAAQGGGYCIQTETPSILDETNTITSDSGSLAGQTVPIVLMHHPQKPPGPQYLFPAPNLDLKRNFKMSTLPLVDNSKKHTTTLPPGYFRSRDENEISTLDRSLLTSQFNDFKDHLHGAQRFDLGLRQFSPELEGNTGSFFGTFHSEGTFMQPILGHALDVPGTSSTTSSSSGGTGSGTTMTTGSSSQSSMSKKSVSTISDKKKKKSVTIGNVFSKMDTFDSLKGDEEPFGCRSGV